MIEPVYIDESRISVGQYMRYTFGLYMKSSWWKYALPLAICLVLSVVNINFLFVAIVLLFLVFTMILYIVVIYYGLVPESRYSTILKDTIVSEAGIDVVLKKLVDTEGDNNVEPCYTLEKIFLHKSSIKGLEAKDDCLLVLFKQPKFSFLAIPYTSFKNEVDLRRAVEFIIDY